MKWMLFFSAIICILSCTEKKKETYAVGKYLYSDGVDRLHISKNCRQIGNMVDFLDTMYVQPNSELKYCNNCFTDSTYEHIQVIFKRNANRKWLYEEFVEANYEMPSYKRYLHGIEDKQIRKQLYNISVKEGLNVGTYGEFSKMLGF